jgi:hypothetical protein
MRRDLSRKNVFGLQSKSAAAEEKNDIGPKIIRKNVEEDTGELND